MSLARLPGVIRDRMTPVARPCASSRPRGPIPETGQPIRARRQAYAVGLPHAQPGSAIVAYRRPQRFACAAGADGSWRLRLPGRPREAALFCLLMPYCFKIRPETESDEHAGDAISRRRTLLFESNDREVTKTCNPTISRPMHSAENS
jgi:hypothetical protein